MVDAPFSIGERRGAMGWPAVSCGQRVSGKARHGALSTTAAIQGLRRVIHREDGRRALGSSVEGGGFESLRETPPAAVS